ncbi:MAG: hypothetical protein HY664_05245 [Chloroflexi bacterium]|nr:hypothetical protein [Chloroflexota bacterium]
MEGGSKGALRGSPSWQREMLLRCPPFVKKSPLDEHGDASHFEKRNFEISLTKAIAKRLLGDENKVELRMLKR